MVVSTRSKTTAPTRPRPPAPPPPDLAAHPSEEDLITRFLRPRAASTNNPCAAFVHDADVYSADPNELTAGFAPAVASNGESAWYFFSAVKTKTRDGQRKARTVDSGEGCWHSEAGAKPVVEVNGRLLGHRQSFSFVTKVDGRRVRSGWLMVEISLDADEEDNTNMVLCKIYFSNRARLNGGAHAASAAGRKRKPTADDSKNNPASSRQRRRRRPAEGDDGEIVNNESSAAAGDEEELWTDDSTLSWWMRNRDRFMKEYNIVDRPDEEIHKTHGIYELMKLLNYDYGSSSRPQPQVDDEDQEFSTWTELVTRC